MQVPYVVQYLPSKGQKQEMISEPVVVEDLAKWPPSGSRFKIMEPMVNIRIMSPMEYAGNIMELIKRKRGTDMVTKPVDDLTWLFSARMPWGEIVTDFHDELKNTSAGYASFDSFDADPPYQEADLVKVDISLNGDSVTPLAFVCHKSLAQTQGREVCKKLQEVLPRQQFVTVIQGI
jgi:GTP-binding protein LepA